MIGLLRGRSPCGLPKETDENSRVMSQIRIGVGPLKIVQSFIQFGVWIGPKWFFIQIHMHGHHSPPTWQYNMR